MKNLTPAAIAGVITAACLLAGAVAHDATLVAAVLGMPVQGGEGVVATAGLGTALAAVAFGLRALRRMRRGRLARA
jgi:hypothetical protein